MLKATELTSRLRSLAVESQLYTMPMGSARSLRYMIPVERKPRPTRSRPSAIPLQLGPSLIHSSSRDASGIAKRVCITIAQDTTTPTQEDLSEKTQLGSTKALISIH